jgi:polyhydroxyalkanoate synthesis regulator phasin
MQINKNSPDYQKRLASVRDLINFKNKYLDLVAMKQSMEYLLYGTNTPPDHETRELRGEISSTEYQMKDLRETFHRKYENDPYNPMMLPFTHFPEELTELWQDVEARQDEVSQKTHEIAKLKSRD